MIKKLFSDRVLIRVLPVEEAVKNIILPEKARIVLYEKAVVAMMGQGKHQGHTQYPIDIKEGDIILIKRGAGDPIKDFDLNEGKDKDLEHFMDGDYRIVIYDEIIGVF